MFWVFLIFLKLDFNPLKKLSNFRLVILKCITLAIQNSLETLDRETKSDLNSTWKIKSNIFQN